MELIRNWGNDIGSRQRKNRVRIGGVENHVVYARKQWQKRHRGGSKAAEASSGFAVGSDVGPSIDDLLDSEGSSKFSFHSAVEQVEWLRRQLCWDEGCLVLGEQIREEERRTSQAMKVTIKARTNDGVRYDVHHMLSDNLPLSHHCSTHWHFQEPVDRLKPTQCFHELSSSTRISTDKIHDVGTVCTEKFVVFDGIDDQRLLLLKLSEAHILSIKGKLLALNKCLQNPGAADESDRCHRDK